MFHVHRTATLPLQRPRVPLSPTCQFLSLAFPKGLTRWEGPGSIQEPRAGRGGGPGSLDFCSTPLTPPPGSLPLEGKSPFPLPLPRGLFSDDKVLRLTLKRGKKKPSALPPPSAGPRVPRGGWGADQQESSPNPARRSVTPRGSPHLLPKVPPRGAQALRVGSFSGVPFPDSRR